MREVAWISFHIVIALPIALVLSVAFRETVRAFVALSAGFRIFEIRLGVGQRLYSEPFGSLNISLGALPLGGAIIAASADATRHRSRRCAIALAPLLAQFVWLLSIWLFWNGAPSTGGLGGLASIQSGFAPLTVLVLAQGILFMLHLFIPFRWGPDEQTDLRTLIDIAMGMPRTHRRARATYYARAAQHSIERGEIESAHASLQQGLTQLGPEPLLLECQTILATREFSSAVDQGESAEALLLLLEWTPNHENGGTLPLYSLERLRRHSVYALPLIALAFGFAATHHDTIETQLTERWIQNAAAIVDRASAADCASHRIKAETWPIQLSPQTPLATRRDHHFLTAQLRACEGALAEADDAAQTALALAEEARATHHVGTLQDAQSWIEDELRLIAILGLQSELALKKGTFRLALQTLKRADRELSLVREQLSQAAGETERPALAQSIDAQQERIRAQRRQIQTEMAAH